MDFIWIFFLPRFSFLGKIGHDGWVQALAFHPCGKFLFSVADDHTMRIWDLKTGRCVKKREH